MPREGVGVHLRIDMSITAMKQALEALEDIFGKNKVDVGAINALRQAIEQAEKKKMPITDDNGQAVQPQFRVIEQRGNWFLLYDQHVVGNLGRHEFRIQKLKHDIVLYSGITLEEAKKRFAEKVEADYE